MTSGGPAAGSHLVHPRPLWTGRPSPILSGAAFTGWAPLNYYRLGPRWLVFNILPASSPSSSSATDWLIAPASAPEAVQMNGASQPASRSARRLAGWLGRRRGQLAKGMMDEEGVDQSSLPSGSLFGRFKLRPDLWPPRRSQLMVMVLKVRALVIVLAVVRLGLLHRE